jgi:hypothetical protein
MISFQSLSVQSRWATWATLLVLPGLCSVVALVLRSLAGPFWLWSNLDPDYFYLFDALHVALLEAPGHIPHPGIPVDTLGAIVLKLRHLGLDAQAMTASVFADPEAQLRAISTVIIAINGLLLLLLGWAALRASGSLVFALLVQLAPLLSSLIVKNAFHVKPESLLIGGTLLFMAAGVSGLKRATLDGNRYRLAILLGVAGGLIGATKVTALPILALPVLLLATPAALAIYGVSVAVSVILFTLPALSVYPMIAEWLTKVVLASGPHGHGAKTVVDIGTYPAEIGRMLRRPPLTVALPLGLAGLAFAAWRRRIGYALPAPEVRLLAGTVLAQFLQAVVVAKQPGAQYMIPAFLLAAFTFGLVFRMAAAAIPSNSGYAAAMPATGVFLAVALTVGGLVSANNMRVELASLRDNALRLDNDRFAACARVYFYSASSPTFALYLAEHTTSVRLTDDRRWRPGFSAQLKQSRPADEFWLDDWSTPNSFRLRDWESERSLADLIAQYPCVMLRGGTGRVSGVTNYLAKTLPDVKFETACSIPDEPIFTYRVGCDGTPR